MNKQTAGNNLWRGFLLTIFMGFFILAYFPVWNGLVSTWSSSDDYSHGFMIIPLVAYLSWQKRALLCNAITRGSWIGLILVLLGLSSYMLGYFGEIATLASLSLLPFLAGTVLFLFGWRVLRLSLFPLFLLLFMIPVPSQIYSSLTIPLQLFVSKVTVALVSLLGVPILREGNVIQLPQHTLQVVQACSGLRSIMTLLTLGAVMGYLMLNGNLLRGVLLVSAIPIAVAVNVLRVFVLVVALYYYGVDLTEGTIHTVLGIGVFAIAIVCFSLVRRVLALWDKSVS